MDTRRTLLEDAKWTCINEGFEDQAAAVDIARFALQQIVGHFVKVEGEWRTYADAKTTLDMIRQEAADALR